MNKGMLLALLIVNNAFSAQWPAPIGEPVIEARKPEIKCEKVINENGVAITKCVKVSKEVIAKH